MQKEVGIPTLSNIHLFLKYEPFVSDDKETALKVSWDSDNELIDKLMSYELRPPSDNIEEYNEDYTFRLNHLWVNNLKEVSKWERGQYLFCFIKTNADGYFNIWYSFDKKLFDDGWYDDLIIEPNGYVVRKFWNI